VKVSNSLTKKAFFTNFISIDLSYERYHKYLLAAILFSTIFLLTGGIYNLTENPPFVQPWKGVGVIYRSINEQFILESLIAALYITLGTGGVFLIHYSTRYIYDSNRSISYLILGIILTLIASWSISALYHFKMNPPPMV
jgi:hypothetical protein